MECAALVRQETVGHRLPPRDHIRCAAEGHELARFRDELVRGIQVPHLDTPFRTTFRFAGEEARPESSIQVDPGSSEAVIE